MTESSRHRLHDRMVTFACGILIGLVITAAVAFLATSDPPPRVQDDTAVDQEITLPDCRHLSDTSTQWTNHHTLCVMSGERFMCDAHGCERVAAAP
jgi:hypothetical protein